MTWLYQLNKTILSGSAFLAILLGVVACAPTFSPGATPRLTAQEAANLLNLAMEEAAQIKATAIVEAAEIKATALAVTPEPEPEPEIEATPAVSAQVSHGEELYNLHCVRCHEVEGGIGPELKPRVVASYIRASRLYNIISATMPYDEPKSLAEQEYWDIVAYIISSKGFATPDLEVGPDNAEELLLENPAK